MPDVRDPRHPGVLVTVGDLVEDVIVGAAGPARYATDNASVVYRARGGSAANVVAFASALVPARFIGCAGDDPVGAARAGHERARSVLLSPGATAASASSGSDETDEGALSS